MHRKAKPDRIVLFLLTALLGGPVAAQIYRCTDGDTTVFSDMPCSETAELFEESSKISVIAPAGDLDRIAESNASFIAQRQEMLALRRDRASKQARQTGPDRQRGASDALVRYRTIIGPAAGFAFGSDRRPTSDPRLEAQRQGSRAHDVPESRRTLLSRSGGSQPRILR